MMNIRVVTVSVAALVFSATSNSSAALVYSTGFEPPAYVVGPSLGNGWTGNGLVQTAVVASGSQALRINANQPLFIQAIHPINVPTANQVFIFEGDMRVDDSFSGGAASFSVWGDTGRIGGFTYYHTHYYFSNMTFGKNDIFPFPPSGGWHHFLLRYDFSTLTITASYDGTPMGSLGIINPTAPTTLTRITCSAETATSPMDAYFDNLSVSVVPEPASLGMFGSGVLILSARRRLRDQARGYAMGSCIVS